MITIKTDLLFCFLLLSARFFWGFPPSACGRTFKRYFFGFSHHDTQLRLDDAFRVLIEHGHFQILHNFVILEILLDLLGLEFLMRPRCKNLANSLLDVFCRERCQGVEAEPLWPGQRDMVGGC